tara:strand:- start:1343 stop:1717 length:375 start_codon:yes stop_codon:yes gene_type:complete
VKKIPILSVIIFIIMSISFIVYQNFSSNTYGSEFVNQIRIADAEKTLNDVPDNALVNIGKNICISSPNWIDIRTSEELIRLELLNNQIDVDEENRIIPILRFQSIYELCPENIPYLEEIFKINE